MIKPVQQNKEKKCLEHLKIKGCKRIEKMDLSPDLSTICFKP